LLRKLAPVGVAILRIQRPTHRDTAATIQAQSQPVLSGAEYWHSSCV
jgi:hypothetical protein